MPRDLVAEGLVRIPDQSFRNEQGLIEIDITGKELNQEAISQIDQPVKSAILNAAKTNSVDPALLFGVAELESNFDPNAGAKTSSAKGLFQFIDSTGRAYGLNESNVFDPSANADAASRFVQDNAPVLRQSLINKGFTEEQANTIAGDRGALYLALQQGASGAAKLIAGENVNPAVIKNNYSSRILPESLDFYLANPKQFAQDWIGHANNVIAKYDAPVQDQQIAQSVPQAEQGSARDLVAEGLISVPRETQPQVAGVGASPQQQRAPTPGIVAGTLAEVQSGLLFEFDDEIGAGIAAGIDIARNLASGNPVDIGESFNRNLDQFRQQKAQFREQNPVLSAVGQAIGAIAPAVATGGAVTAARTGQGALRQTAEAAATGALAGGAFSTGQAEEDKATAFAKGAGLGALTGGAVGAIAAPFTALSNRNQRIVDILQTRPDARVSQYVLRNQKAVRLPQLQEAAKQGVDDGVLHVVKGTTPQDRAKFRKMLDIGVKAKRDPKFAAVNRTSNVIGESIQERLLPVFRENRKSGRAIDRIARNDLKGRPVDASPAIDKFIDDLDRAGISFDRSTLELGFKGSDIQDLPQLQNVFIRTVNRLKDVDNPDALQLHRAKRYLDQNIAYGKLKEGLSGKTESIVKNLRRNIDQVLDNNFPAYKQANDVYSESIQAISELQNLAGKKVDLNGKDAARQLGILSRRITSNAQSSTRTLSVFDELQNLATKYGEKIEDDLISQVVVNDELIRLFNLAPKNSLGGEVQSSIERAATQLATGSPRAGAAELATGAIKTGANKLRGVDEENLIKSLNELFSVDSF